MVFGKKKVKTEETKAAKNGQQPKVRGKGRGGNSDQSTQQKQKSLPAGFEKARDAGYHPYKVKEFARLPGQDAASAQAVLDEFSAADRLVRHRWVLAYQNCFTVGCTFRPYSEDRKEEGSEHGFHVNSYEELQALAQTILAAENVEFCKLAPRILVPNKEGWKTIVAFQMHQFFDEGESRYRIFIPAAPDPTIEEFAAFLTDERINHHLEATLAAAAKETEAKETVASA